MTDRKAADKPTPQQREEIGRSERSQQEELDAGLRDSFPASDPAAVSQPSTATPSIADRPNARAGDRTRAKLATGRSRVNVSTKQDIGYWTRKFGVEERELKQAVRKAGFLPQDVANYLGKTL